MPLSEMRAKPSSPRVISRSMPSEVPLIAPTPSASTSRLLQRGGEGLHVAQEGRAVVASQ